ncbi:MAG: glycosyltransferase family 2 protein [Bacteroidales bacterium]|nr:glycosyltransferase family 2 protein [Bacteroidales bacterium]MCF8388116.1 glycosyltransferase family 2 protein [Bacteroidales bacterium]MCF8398775.1 glycosyltransferase family 2 protein [Bacteroidales bacterium]
MKDFVSIIIPIHNEEPNIAELTEGIVAEMKTTKYGFELIYINDGSTDDSWKRIREVSDKFEEVRGIDLAGNYGQTIAMRVGFKETKGDFIIAYDGDQQHEPRYLHTFIKYLEEGYDMVSADKAIRADGWLKDRFAKAGHWTISKITGVKLRYFGATPKAYRSYMVKDLNMLGDEHRFIGATMVKKGIKYIEFPMTIQSRKGGKSNYKLSKIFLVIIDLIFLKFILSYMNKPFRLFGLWGGLIFLIGLVFSLIMTIGSLFFGINIRENYLAEFLFFTSMTLIGLLLVSIGILAEIGIFNYYAGDIKKPYVIRKKTDET